MDHSLDGLFRRSLRRPAPSAPAGLEGDFVVVDCARSPAIYPAMTNSRAASASMYSGSLGPELARVTPYIVKLEQGSSFLRTFYAEGWNNAWGIVLRTSASLSALRRHLRTLAYAQRSHGSKLLFRYYDPRVLRVFLPTCDELQLGQLFGPIDAFVLDGTEGGVPLVASRRAGGGVDLTDASGQAIGAE